MERLSCFRCSQALLHYLVEAAGLDCSGNGVAVSLDGAGLVGVAEPDRFVLLHTPGCSRFFI